jgi:hypothetical protein
MSSRKSMRAGKYPLRTKDVRWTSADISLKQPGWIWHIVLYDDTPVPDFEDAGFTHSEWIIPEALGATTEEVQIKAFLRVLNKGKLPLGAKHVGGAKFKPPHIMPSRIMDAAVVFEAALDALSKERR